MTAFAVSETTAKAGAHSAVILREDRAGDRAAILSLRSALVPSRPAHSRRA